MTRKDMQGYVLLACVAIFFGGVFYLKHVITAAADNIDPETLCRMNADDPAIELLIDKTDPWDNNSQKKIAQLIRSLKTRLAVHERLSIYILDETGTYSPAPLFDMCNPGRGDQANTLYQNPRLVQQKFDEQFAAPLDALLDTLLRPGTAPQSPIIETMHALRGNRKQKLIIVSDMMQNSGMLSLYGNSNQHDTAICRMDSPYQEIQVYSVNRHQIDIVRKQAVRNFWQDCLQKSAWKAHWSNL